MFCGSSQGGYFGGHPDGSRNGWTSTRASGLSGSGRLAGEPLGLDYKVNLKGVPAKGRQCSPASLALCGWHKEVQTTTDGLQL